MSNIFVTYQVLADNNTVADLARKIAIEQSVEVPESLITPVIENRFVGKVEEIKTLNKAANQFSVTLSYPEEILSRQFNQLINLCFGNVSMYQSVKCTEVVLPESQLKNFAGPQFGIEGIRRCLGVYGRPLLATALKPRGNTEENFAQMAYEFALGGGDIIKDDQNLIGTFDEFKRRVTACLSAIEKAQDKTGRTCLYFPFISAPFEEIEKYFEWARKQGVQGVLMAPLILGLDTARGLATKYNMIYMAHPSFTGGYCVAPHDGMHYSLLYGFLFRLAGVDISVFPNTGGRFQFLQQDCKAIADALHKPLGHIKSAFPCPAGGMQYEHLDEMCRWYQQDSVLLLGGSLLEYSSSLSKSTRAFLDKIIDQYPEAIEPRITMESVSACEYPASNTQSIIEHIKFDDFQWQGRESIQYKDINDTTFKDVRRVELIGKNGEETEFDLRYFEIEKGGFSSKEKHIHTHVVIVVRGEGIVTIGDQEYYTKENDVLYIAPMTIHQLSNNNDEPFGFYCIVDHERDRPVIVN